MRFPEHITSQLCAIERAGLLRTARQVDGAQGPTVSLDGREVILLCSNNYLGLAGHPALVEAQHAALVRWGTGAGASRLISGTMAPHRDAEAALAVHFDAPAAILFSTGYAANVGALQALVGPEDLVLSDQLNHASLIDGCRLSRARVEVYRHRDVDHLGALLRAHRTSARAAMVVTDTLFSMDGDLAPVAELRAVCDRWDAGLLVDEAHAIGVLGPRGRGACAAAGVRPDVLIGTLGKALGLAGAFVAGSEQVARLIENRARSYVFSTAIPPALAASIPVALALAADADGARARLAAHARAIRSRLSDLGVASAAGDSAIVPWVLGDTTRTMSASSRLLELGVFVHGIRPPTVPPGGARLRIVPMATHEDRHIADALTAFETVARELGR